jgi:hypothetical protein
MIIAPVCFTAGLTLAVAGAFTVGSPGEALADVAATDRHELPAFVLQRVELANGGQAPEAR